MNKYSVGEIIEMAVQTERLGYQFYTEMAERFKDDQKLNELCGTLALKERATRRFSISSRKPRARRKSKAPMNSAST